MEGYEVCYSHRPDLAEERRRNASKGGKRGGRGRAASSESEMVELKREAAMLYSRVIEGEISPSVGAVAVQSLNLRSRLWESERRARLAEAEVVTAEQMRHEVELAAEIITKHVTDRRTLAAIRHDLKQLDEARRHAP